MPAPYTPPAANEVVVRVRAIAVNFIDGIPGFLYRVVLPWLTFPAVVGSDVAGEVVEVGAGVMRLRPGDRVLGHAFGVEKSQNRAAEGAFQHYVVLMQHMVSPIPGSLSFERAAVLPLALSTAATGMFQQDHLGLAMPGAVPVERSETVLVWGGSTRSWTGSATARSPARSPSDPGHSHRRSRSRPAPRAASASHRRSPGGSYAYGPRGHGDSGCG
ncbi:alcohol dehydrogenase catalytic domain-containing protein [Microbispora bryophytorum]|uniref:alcohol dehydrogenase catalytic domain-containing protein n=1 Tax=Microbispora bryophytorum TaxID=1460882 RepID=UPI0033F5DE3E